MKILGGKFYTLSFWGVVCGLMLNFSAQAAGQIIRIEEKAVIDGKGDEAFWSDIEPFNQFTQNYPTPGNAPTFRTEVRMYYNNEGITILAHMWDPAPDSILRQLSGRDRIENSDHFSVVIDPFQSGLNGQVFGVTASGVQNDRRIDNGVDDYSWNAIWYSAVDIHDKGWTVEMFIPYFSFRFPDKEKQTWNFNFIRQIRRIREESSWAFINPGVNGWINQCKPVDGINHIQSPIRFQLTPYLSGYYRNTTSDGSQVADYTVNGGMDLKLGLSDAFTLDMTLIPDFGQVRSDNRVLNLSPFELFFSENRPFFQEGTKMFTKSNLFYSRRVGGTPIRYYETLGSLDSGEVFVKNPDRTQLLNASKVTGRTSSGLGVGIFNAIEGNTFAEIRKEDGTTRTVKTGVPTNYNVLVLDQNIKNNGFITFTQTSVMREGAERDAFSNAFQFRVADSTNTFSNYTSIRRTDIRENDGKKVGFNYWTEFAKSGGNWRYGVNHGIESDTYDPNDMGFLRANNEIANFAFLRYHSFSPSKYFNSWRLGASSFYGMLYKPNTFSEFELEVNGFGLLRSWNALGFSISGKPVEGRDYFEPRKAGAVYNTPRSIGGNVWISSDYRRTFALDANISIKRFPDIPQRNRYIRLSPRMRVNDKLAWIYVISNKMNLDEQGFATFSDSGNVVFGHRDNREWTNVVEMNYIFNAKSSLSLRVRHNWSTVKYNRFFELNEATGELEGEGELASLEPYGNINRNFNTFSIDMVYRWIFSPGSELNIVYKNNLDDDRDALIDSFRGNLTEVWENPQSKVGSLSFRFVYFLDAGKLFRMN